MQQVTTGSIRQGHCSLWKRLLQIAAPLVAGFALALIAVLFMSGLSLVFVDQQNIAHAAEGENTSQPTTYVQPTHSDENTTSAATASDDSMMSMMQRMMSMMQKHAMGMPAKAVTINGDVIVIVINKPEMGKELEVELQCHSHLPHQ